MTMLEEVEFNIGSVPLDSFDNDYVDIVKIMTMCLMLLKQIEDQ
jgi:hypothetical protein